MGIQGRLGGSDAGSSEAQQVEAIARRVVELLEAGRHQAGDRRGELVDAAELALRLRVDRSWIYEHSADLGAIRLGPGKRPRLRFDPLVAIEQLQVARSGDRSQHGRRRPRRSLGGEQISRLLPIKGEGGKS